MSTRNRRRTIYIYIYKQSNNKMDNKVKRIKTSRRLYFKLIQQVKILNNEEIGCNTQNY
jgi:hypothetical protein